MWLTLSLISALFLGLYDVAKKQSVTGNAVFPVLFFSTLSGALCMVPLLVLSAVNPPLAKTWHVFVSPQPLSDHLFIITKSFIVGTSWVLSYFGLKHLPITIAAPLRATAPLFTVIGAVLIFGERPSGLQWAGIVLILASYILYSRSGKKRSAERVARVWIVFMIFAAITGAFSGGFDKYLLQSRALPPLFVLSWFLIYLTGIFALINLVLWVPYRSKFTSFNFRPAIVLIGLLLVIADIAYMKALSDPMAKLALVSSIRRTNVLISFAGGILLFREGDIRAKLAPFAGIVTGLLLIML